MRKQPSRAERVVWDLVRDRKLAAKFRRQHPVDNYIADFACIDAKLIVEVDGRSHDVSEQQDYDAQRGRRLRELGWRILVVRDDDVLRDASAVMELIRSALRATPSP
jgi:very-short-patch-repair endonuclease